MIEKFKTFFLLQLIITFTLFSNNLFAQSINTFHLDISNTPSTIYPEKKYDITLLVPFSNRQNFMFGYSPINKLAVYTSFQNQSYKRKTSTTTTLGVERGDYRTSSQSYNISVGWNIFGIKNTNKKILKEENTRKRKVKFLMEGRLGIARHSLKGEYEFPNVADAKNKFVYNTVEGGLHLIIINKTALLKFTNKYVRVNYKKISLNGSIFSSDNALRIIHALNKENVFHIYIFDTSILFNAKRLGYLFGANINFSADTSVINFVGHEATVYLGLSYKF